MENVQDVFSTDDLQIAVLFVDDENVSHLTPNCERIQGATKVVTDMNDRGSFVCFCIPVPVRRSPRLTGPSLDAPNNGASADQSAHRELPPWPSDLPEAKLTDGDSVADWLSKVPRKLTPSDIAAIPILKRFATDYVMDSTNHTMPNGDPNEFIVSVADACARYSISPGQAKGVLNWWRAQVNRQPKPTATSTVSSNLDLSSLEPGMYAVPNGNTRLKVQINKPGPNRKWHGWVFVNDGAAYGQQTKYGAQRPGQFYSGDIEEQLKAIVADPIAAIAAYGHLTGSCGICGRKLEDETSVERGIGPICYAKLMS